MKGLAVETILYAIILVIALVILTFVITKLIPTFGDFVDSSLKGIKLSLCNSFGMKLLLGC